MLSEIKADRRLVVSEGWASESVLDQANHSRIEILDSLDKFGQYLSNIADKKGLLNKAHSRVEYSVTTTEENKASNSNFGELRHH